MVATRRCATVERAILLVSLCCCTLVSAEESDGTVKTSVNIAGYLTKHNVCEHSFIDKDIKDIEAEMNKKSAAGFAEALKIYNDGKNSQTISKMRTLAEFWPGAHINSLGLDSSAEPFLKMFDEYQTAKSFNPHISAVAAIKGEDSDTLGKYETDRVAKEFDFRNQVTKKNVKFQVVMIYALHELEIAISAAEQGKDIADSQRYIDVWWAFYAGSMETGDGLLGFGPYVLAERRAIFFGTDTVKIGNGGTSKVNDILLKATVEISRLISAPTKNLAAMKNIMKCVRAQLKVPLIQGCIQYGYKTDPTTNFDDVIDESGYNSEFARKGELWSFCSGVLPFLHAVNPSAADTLLAQVNVNTLAGTDTARWNMIKGVFTAENLNKLGVKCADVGGFVNQNTVKTSATTLNSDFPVCIDITQEAPDDADSAQCSGNWMNSPVTSNEGLTCLGVTPGVALDAGDVSGAVRAPAATLPVMIAGIIIANLFAH